MRNVLVALAVLGFAVSGCAKKVDLEAERAALLKTDADWAAAVASNNAEAFASFFAEDAIVQAPHLPQMNGIEAVRQWIDTSMSFPGFAVTWTATSAEVAASGEMGYTYGNFTFHITMPDGSPLDDYGKYATIWKKQADGSWKVAVDSFNSDVMMMPPPSAAPADTTVQGQ
jgi:ketosteroid isomerase-like protein